MKRVLATALAAIAATSFMIGTVSSASAADTADPAAIAASARAGITPNSDLPIGIQVDDTKYKVVETLRGVGKQVYDCVNGAYKFGSRSRAWSRSAWSRPGSTAPARSGRASTARRSSARAPSRTPHGPDRRTSPG